mmetsp:Transcript_6067/g.21552  ORF Transcript_6067/g.21552 Transcript_6067/m.21552 type:complete len:478 (-) Transcript_6067:994-2427(-)
MASSIFVSMSICSISSTEDSRDCCPFNSAACSSSRRFCARSRRACAWSDAASSSLRRLLAASDAASVLVRRSFSETAAENAAIMAACPWSDAWAWRHAAATSSVTMAQRSRSSALSKSEDSCLAECRACSRSSASSAFLRPAIRSFANADRSVAALRRTNRRQSESVESAAPESVWRLQLLTGVVERFRSDRRRSLDAFGDMGDAQWHCEPFKTEPFKGAREAVFDFQSLHASPRATRCKSPFSAFARWRSTTAPRLWHADARAQEVRHCRSHRPHGPRKRQVRMRPATDCSKACRASTSCARKNAALVDCSSSTNHSPTHSAVKHAFQSTDGRRKTISLPKESPFPSARQFRQARRSTASATLARLRHVVRRASVTYSSQGPTSSASVPVDAVSSASVPVDATVVSSAFLPVDVTSVSVAVDTITAAGTMIAAALPSGPWHLAGKAPSSSSARAAPCRRDDVLATELPEADAAEPA